MPNQLFRPNLINYIFRILQFITAILKAFSIFELMQKNDIYKEWEIKKQKGIKSLAVLIDPDKANENHLNSLCDKAEKGQIDYFFVGGSHLSTNNLDFVISYLKINCEIPVILFPGNTMQVNLKADGILLLSLISGRNADLLIGKHVEVAPLLHNSSLEILSTGYILIESGKPNSVSYISNTTPIPRDKPEIATSTAMAGEMLGLKSIYLESGSGAMYSVSAETIAMVSNRINTPLIVGGGIKDAETAQMLYEAGADIIVVGTQIESHQSFIDELAIVNKIKSSI